MKEVINNTDLREALCSVLCTQRMSLALEIYRRLVTADRPLTLSEIARSVGGARTTVWKALRGLKALGLVDNLGRKWAVRSIQPSIKVKLLDYPEPEGEDLLPLITSLLADYVGRPWIAEISVEWDLSPSGILRYREVRKVLRLTKDP